MTICLHGRRISLDCIEFFRYATGLLQQQYYCSTTTAAGVIVPGLSRWDSTVAVLRVTLSSYSAYNVRLRGAVRLRRIRTTKAARVGLHIDAHI